MSGGSPAPQPFQPPNQAGAAAGLQGAANTLSAGGQTVQNAAIPGYQSIYSAVQNNPYYGQAQQLAGQTSQTGYGFGKSEIGAAQGLQGLASSLGQYAPGIAATAFDPQQQGYNQAYQQQNQQGLAGLAGSGLGGSPFAAGLSQQGNQQFNIDWQNNQQQRQLAGVGALGQLAQTQSGLQTSAGDLGTAGLNSMVAAENLPSQTYMAQEQADTAALDSLVTGDVASFGPTQAAASAETSYLGIGQEASQNALNSYKAQQQADQSFWSGIGKLGGDALNIGLAFAGL